MGQIQQGINQLISSAQWATAIAVHQPNVQAARKEKAELNKIKEDLPRLQQEKKDLEEKIFEIGSEYEVDNIPQEAYDYGKVVDA